MTRRVINGDNDGEVSAGKIRGDKGEYDVVGDEEVLYIFDHNWQPGLWKPKILLSPQ